MVEIDLAYEGELRCEAVHGPSRTRLQTDAPLDNQGRGESFSPTDLVAAALGSCMLTLMGIRSRKFGWNIDGTRAHVRKEMAKEPPRRIATLAVRLTVQNSASLDEAARDVLVEAALTCPVRLSIHDAIDVPVDFEWV
jgi:putative redox protein